ncbi:imidazoleglycerol-phosphate dehydratase HisB [Campylobacter hyointestinalis]|uniref:Imidazoleglycerol-phosphate dehydratase n=2 Tax=Campylobacter hyointestinalis TaxID=198 RepID=A0AAV6EG88_CAMHY|nr:imidazoleglycerol-phosphate dehydratase HisB [Campylobacter hyointestinalis]ANE33972.1 imidazoleglycerol-phosphate dehydratase [Campylobacter hyointestinalis subsp. lawsonii CCUG 27631]KAB0614106.1 imidazoleglycerol-phosphate dehydratase HisB [Campylobacter hyointestinalis subsp. lawsonii]QKF69843.1 imidazoleglycerol-phosphate dehydratase [Campylobacter hyointestinalis subsp. lawsonii]RAZ29813.1 imidazoleglycerol-phosphate dehydratase HisB [Campylobacter hyointestinalis subsp. lawsonii]RAZ4
MIKKHRVTKETDIELELEINGSGKSEINTGIGFFDHMLISLAKHSLMDIKLSCKGDLFIDDHHSVEDCGIVLGSAIKESIYPLKGVERYANSVVVMDEAAVECAMDLSNRAYLVYESKMNEKIGTFDSELIEEFFRALAMNAGITLHIIKLRGTNSHHIAEASFKAFAVAFRRAMSKNERIGIPSTKGIL